MFSLSLYTPKIMRFVPAALFAALLLAGCANDISPEDRDFFYSGWVHPNKAAEKRLMGQSTGEETAKREAAAAGGTQSLR